MYLDEIAAAIRKYIPEDRMPEGNVDELLRLYAILLRAKGSAVTQSDIHDAWSAWMATQDKEHVSLVAYESLSEVVQKEDKIFATAVRCAADQMGHGEGSHSGFTEILFPSGPPVGEADTRQAIDLYRMMVQSSESLVARRQGVNTFFLTINGILFSAFGIIVQNLDGNRLSGLGITLLAIIGAILCAAWRSLIKSFGQLNRGKFQVINTIERYLKIAIYAGEWEALGRGSDPRVYRSFTSREIWVPNALLVLYVIFIVAAVLYSSEVIMSWLQCLSAMIHL